MSLIISYPAIVAVPLDGLMSPVNILNVVVLPAPGVHITVNHHNQHSVPSVLHAMHTLYFVTSSQYRKGRKTGGTKVG